ncbi:hypothetical protein KF840_16590 [bacterium]|nr:hypothetical protein [bacterium]
MRDRESHRTRRRHRLIDAPRAERIADAPLAPLRRALLSLLFAAGVLSTPVPAAAATPCDVDAVRAAAVAAFPTFTVADVRAQGGVVTLLLTSRAEIGTFALALHATGGQLYTSQMAVRLSDADRGLANAQVGALFDDTALRGLLLACGAEAAFARPEDRDRAMRAAIEAALAMQDRGADRTPRASAAEAAVVVGALLCGIVIAAWPWRAGGADLRALVPPALDAALLVAIAAAGVAVALRIASQMAAEIDEVVTLAARGEDFSFLVSWAPGGEPFNPPGAATLFAAWLRLFDGFLAARLLSIALIPLTAVAAYRAGVGLAGRVAGLCFAALVVSAPAYLRLAAIARAYALIALVLCLLLAAVRGPRTRPSRGVAVALAAIAALWTSYLLWPLAAAAPWLAGLARRDRLRVGGALAVVAAALVPRILAGVGEARAKSGTFELAGALDTLAHALASAAQATPLVMATPPAGQWWSALCVGLALLGMGGWLWWQRRPRALLQQAIVVGLAFLPLAALLSGGHGIRDRHALGLQIVLAWVLAGALALMLTAAARSLRAWGATALAALAALSWSGTTTVLQLTADWPPELARHARDADVVVIVPTWAEGTVHAMLTGRAAEGSDTFRMPPICPLGTEKYCRHAANLRSVAVDQPSAELVDAVAGYPRSLWLFDTAHLAMTEALQGCDRFIATPNWTAFDCRGAALRRE